MSVHSEWDLLTISEDIEPGDEVNVEDTDTGAVSLYIYVKSDKKWTYLRNKESREIIKFNAETLEDYQDLSLLILGKA